MYGIIQARILLYSQFIHTVKLYVFEPRQASACLFKFNSSDPGYLAVYVYSRIIFLIDEIVGKMN